PNAWDQIIPPIAASTAVSNEARSNQRRLTGGGMQSLLAGGIRPIRYRWPSYLWGRPGRTGKCAHLSLLDAGGRETIRPGRSGKELDRVAEDSRSCFFRAQAVARPMRVLRRQHVALRVRHQPEHPAARIADAGDVALGAVRVDWIG